MRPQHLAPAVALALVAGWAWGQEGLRPPPDAPWPRWQTRLEVIGPLTPAPSAPNADSPAARPGARVFGDYYLLDLGDAVDGFAGGLRATSGLTVGARGLATGMPPGIGGSGLAWRDRDPMGGRDLSATSLPYLGLGVTGLSLRGGWGVSADIGLAGYDPAGGLRPGRAGAELNAAEEVLRELRLTPVLQLGVSYSF
jgi:hypothetical protein